MINGTFGYTRHRPMEMFSQTSRSFRQTHKTGITETVRTANNSIPNILINIILNVSLVTVHFYNYLSDGWSPSIYPRPRFVSEYGFQSFPSLNSWKSVLSPGNNLSELMDHRQHFPAGGSAPVINLIQKHLPLPAENSRRYLSALIYLSQVSQAMIVRTETEVYRYTEYASPDWHILIIFW